MKMRTIRIKDKSEAPRCCAEFCDILWSFINRAEKGECVYPVELEIFAYTKMPERITED